MLISRFVLCTDFFRRAASVFVNYPEAPGFDAASDADADDDAEVSSCAMRVACTQGDIVCTGVARMRTLNRWSRMCSSALDISHSIQLSRSILPPPRVRRARDRIRCRSGAVEFAVRSVPCLPPALLSAF